MDRWGTLDYSRSATFVAWLSSGQLYVFSPWWEHIFCLLLANGFFSILKCWHLSPLMTNAVSYGQGCSIRQSHFFLSVDELLNYYLIFCLFKSCLYIFAAIVMYKLLSESLLAILSSFKTYWANEFYVSFWLGHSSIHRYLDKYSRCLCEDEIRV